MLGKCNVCNFPFDYSAYMQHIVIIGNGIAGVTTARHVRKLSNDRITIISAESKHFFSRTALMYIYMGHMTYNHTKPYEDSFWEKNRIELKQGYVETVNFENKSIAFSNGEHMEYDKLVLAVGSKPRMYGWPGQELEGVQGLYSLQDLENLEMHAPNNQVCKRAVVVGGGLIGIELAEMLSSRNIPVTFLVRENSFWSGVLPEPDSQLITKHIIKHGIDLRLNANLKEIIGNEKVNAIKTEEGETIECDFVGITTGVEPNIDFIRTTALAVDKGILVNRFLETNIPDVYAIGDCSQNTEPNPGRKPIEAVWYTGRMMGETLAQTLCGNKLPYNPGQWFNSAKFFDIEYQTYGQVSSERNRPAEETHFHWQHPSKEKCITMSYHRDTQKILGINSLGIRIRHDIMDQWLSESREIEFVINNFEKALFDPEFFENPSKLLRSKFHDSFKIASR